MIEHVVEFLTSPEKMLVVVSFVLAAVVSLMAWKHFNKVWLLYVHALFMLAPLFYAAISVNCTLGMVNGLLSWCTFVFAKLVLYVLPPILGGIVVLSVFFLPRIYKRLARPLKSSLFEKLTKSTGISAELFVLDRAKPMAFTVGKFVFVSVGMFEMLSKKELEAVLLHELYHVKSRSSLTKVSSLVARISSPLAWFSVNAVECEEKAADAFAVKMQKTNKFVLSAKSKV